jgi:hypothetical protein
MQNTSPLYWTAEKASQGYSGKRGCMCGCNGEYKSGDAALKKHGAAVRKFAEYGFSLPTVLAVTASSGINFDYEAPDGTRLWAASGCGRTACGWDSPTRYNAVYYEDPCQ